MRRALPLLLGALLIGCFDLAPAESDPGPENAGTETAAETDAPPTETAEAPKSFEVQPGEGVTVAGTIRYEGSKSGKIRIDVLGQKDKQMFELLKPLGLEDWGDWSFDAPKGFGEVKIVGFLDQTGDGPSDDDAAMIYDQSVDIGDVDITGLELVLVDGADLASLTPGAQGGEAPPPPPDKEGEGEEGAPGAETPPADAPPEEEGEAPAAE
ncbi:MAG: hypothetical protein QGH45_20190 [Myxococcota bacterium]|jgi:hypothetical protein|nr:hypothetical protein [Myxococcota bacterium]